jgi:hypothetical protein
LCQSEEKDEEQIKVTVQKFWEKAKINDFEGHKSLVADPNIFSGVMQVELNFLFIKTMIE